MRSPRAFLLVAIGLALLVGETGCTVAAKRDRHLKDADRYFNAGDFEKAEIEYLNVLQLERSNPQAIAQLGVLYFDEGRLGRAIPFLIKGRELQPKNFLLRSKLGALFLSNGEPLKAREEANYILDRKPDDERAPLLLAGTATNAKDIADIRARLMKLPAPAPQQAPVLVALGALNLREGNFKAAAAAFASAQAADPKSVLLYSALGAMYQAQNDLPDAEKAMKTASDLSAPRSPERLQYASLKILTGDLATGRTLLEQITRAAPDYLPAQIKLAELDSQEKKFPESTARIAKVLAKDPTNPEAMLLSGHLKLAAGNSAAAVSDFEKDLKVFPNLPQLHYQLGLAYAASGDTEKAIASLNHAVALAPRFPEAVVTLAGLNIRKGDSSTAIVSLEKLLQQNPDNTEGWLLLAGAYGNQGNLDSALKVYSRLEEAFPTNPEPFVLAGVILAQQQKTAEARNAFNRALEIRPDYLQAVEQLVNLDLAEKQYAVALARVETEISKLPKLAGPRLLLAKICLAQGDSKRAEEALSKAIAVEPESLTAYFLLARLYVSTHQHEKALANLNEVVVKNPKDTSALVLIAMIEDQQKDYAGARKSYEKTLAVNPRSTVALNNLAFLYSEHFGELDKAYDVAQRARELLPHEPHIADTLGWILYKRHEYTWAISLLRESAGNLPASADIQFHLGMTYYMLGDEEHARLALKKALELDPAFDDAEETKTRLALLAIDGKTAGANERATLEKAAAQQTNDPVALARLADLYEKDGVSEKAIDTWEAALHASPDNLRAMTNLVRLYGALHKTEKAMELAKAARKLAPDDPEVAHALGRLAFLAGDHPWALSLFEEASRKLSDDPTVLSDLGEAYYSVGRVPEAKAVMRRVLTLSDSRTAPATARGGEAGRFLAMTAVTASPSTAANAEPRVEDVLKSDPTYVPALEAQATVSEMNRDSTAAIATYEKILSYYPDFAPAKRRLAVLYAGNPATEKRAYELAAKARESFPDDPELAKVAGVILYRQGDFPQAASLLGIAAAGRETDADVLFYLGMTQLKLGQRKEAKVTLQRCLDLNLKDDFAPEARRALAGLK